MTMISMLAYNARPIIYGVIIESSELVHGVYVTWNMEQIFNLEMDHDINVNYKLISTNHLTLVRHTHDSNVGEDAYLQNLFTHDGTIWDHSAWMPKICSYYNVTTISSFGLNRNSCRRLHHRTKIAMMHQYYNLSNHHNDHLSNKQK